MARIRTNISIEEQVKEDAEAIAKARGLSLSRMIELYLRSEIESAKQKLDSNRQ